MQCSFTLESDCETGLNLMKMVNHYKNPYKKETNIDNIVDQLCTRLQDIKDQESASRTGMPTCSIEQAEAVRRYNAAFPALKKGQESPLQYYLPPPAWCRKSSSNVDIKMQSDLPMLREWITKNKKNSSNKDRRNSFHGQKKNKKRSNSYNRSFESKESLPEWMTHEGVWDMETQDPVKEFIRAIALDEGYGTCENTVTDEIKEIREVKFGINDNMVPDWDDSLNLEAGWIIKEDLNPRVKSPTDEELYAKFEAKFDSSIEALWSKDQNTPDDEYQELPIDFQDLLSSPSDQLFGVASVEKCSLIFTESIWSNDASEGYPIIDRLDSTSKIADALHDRFKPLNLADTETPRELESFSLYEGQDIYDVFSSVAKSMRSFTAINHSRDHSAFVEVPPIRNRTDRFGYGVDIQPKFTEETVQRPPSNEREDLLTSSRTHFRPIRRETETKASRYADGDTFDIRGDLDTIEFERSESGGFFLGKKSERYLEYRSSRSVNYGRLNLTAAQRCPELEEPGFRLRFPVRQLDIGVQTDECPVENSWSACEECGRAAKKMRPSDIESIWSESNACEACVVPPVQSSVPADELSREWEELLSDISAAHAQYSSTEVEEALVSADRKRRHSVALRGAGGDGIGEDGGRGVCTHPHARFLHCCVLALDRPLTR